MAQPNKSPVAVVTGVGPGLGGALARRFARGGYAVAMMARSRGFIEELSAELTAEGARAIAVSADMGAVEQVNAAFAAVRAELGPVDVLLYNAGGAAWGNVAEIGAEQFEQAWRVNALGAFASAKAVAPDMTALGSVWAGEVRDAWAGAVAGARPRPAGNPRRLDQRRRHHRHPAHPRADAQSQGRRRAQAGGDRRDLLAPGPPGSQRVDNGARSAAVQGEILNARPGRRGGSMSVHHSASGRGTVRRPRGPAKVIPLPAGRRSRRHRRTLGFAIAGAGVVVVGVTLVWLYLLPLIQLMPWLTAGVSAQESEIMRLVNDERRRAG